MQTDTSKSSVESIAAIGMLDLDPLKIKLMDLEEGHGWTRAKADRMGIEYKRFLMLMAKYPQQIIVPSRDVDRFWHAHILDTLKYAQDCDRIFGYFLHHFPYFGMRGVEDAANLAAAASTTAQLHALEFGSEAASEAAHCGATQAATYCGATIQPASFSGQTADWRRTTQVAYCGKVDLSAYCGRTEVAAYCGRVSTVSAAPVGTTDIMRAEIRPALPS